MEYRNYLIYEDPRKGYVTSNRYLVFDRFFYFKGANDTVEYAQNVIDMLISKEEKEIEESIRAMECGCKNAEEHNNHTVHCDICGELYNDDEVTEVGTNWFCWKCHTEPGKIEKALISFLKGQASFEKIRKESPDMDKSVWTDEYHEGYIDGLKRAVELVECGDYLSELD